jgi:hypothetical protein
MRVYVTSLLGTVAWTSAVFLSCATFAVWLLLGFDRQYAVPKFSLEAPKTEPSDGRLAQNEQWCGSTTPSYLCDSSKPAHAPNTPEDPLTERRSLSPSGDSDRDHGGVVPPKKPPEGRSAIPKADYGLEDLDRLHSEYKANQARFMRTFKGRTFEARMPLHSVTEHIIGRDTYSVDFGKGWPSDLDCPTIDENTTAFVINKNKGDILQVRGIIKDHTFAAVQLSNCVIHD